MKTYYIQLEPISCYIIVNLCFRYESIILMMESWISEDLWVWFKTFQISKRYLSILLECDFGDIYNVVIYDWGRNYYLIITWFNIHDVLIIIQCKFVMLYYSKLSRNIHAAFNLRAMILIRKLFFNNYLFSETTHRQMYC